MRTLTATALLTAMLANGGCSTGTDGPSEDPAIMPATGTTVTRDEAPAAPQLGGPTDGRRGLFSNTVPSFSLDDAGLLFECGKGSDDDYQEIYPSNIIDVAESYYFEDLDGLLTRFQTILFDKYSMAMFIAAFDVTDGLDGVGNVLDLGTGTGALSFAALAHGAERAVGTELDPLALRNANFNAEQLGVADRFEVRLVSFEDQGAYSTIGSQERFDLILTDPPQGIDDSLPRYFPEVRDELDAEGSRELFFTADTGSCFLLSIFEGLDAHLSDNGRLLLAIKTREGRGLVHELAEKHGFESRILLDMKDERPHANKRLIGNSDLTPDMSLRAVIVEVTRGEP